MLESKSRRFDERERWQIRGTTIRRGVPGIMRTAGEQVGLLPKNWSSQ